MDRAPVFNAKLCEVSTIYAYQMCDIPETTITTVPANDFPQDDTVSDPMSSCLKCNRPVINARSRDNGWILFWDCAECGHLKQATERIRVFMTGCDKYEITPDDVSRHAVFRFPWSAPPPGEYVMNKVYQQVPIVMRRDGQSLREVLNGADFFGYYGVLEQLATTWCLNHRFKFHAVRLDGVIFIGHIAKKDRTGEEKGKEDEREIRNSCGVTEQTDLEASHYRLNCSKLQWMSDPMDERSQAMGISLACLAEIDSFEGGEAVEIKSCGDTKDVLIQAKKRAWMDRNLSSSIKMSLGGIEKLRCRFGDGKEEKYSWAEVEAISDEPFRRLRRRTDISWDFLVQTLLDLKQMLNEDGKHCMITSNRDWNRFSQRGWGTVHMQPTGQDLDCLRPDFRECFSI